MDTHINTHKKPRIYIYIYNSQLNDFLNIIGVFFSLRLSFPILLTSFSSSPLLFFLFSYDPWAISKKSRYKRWKAFFFFFVLLFRADQEIPKMILATVLTFFLSPNWKTRLVMRKSYLSDTGLRLRRIILELNSKPSPWRLALTVVEVNMQAALEIKPISITSHL